MVPGGRAVPTARITYQASSKRTSLEYESMSQTSSIAGDQAGSCAHGMPAYSLPSPDLTPADTPICVPAPWQSYPPHLAPRASLGCSLAPIQAHITASATTCRLPYSMQQPVDGGRASQAAHATPAAWPSSAAARASSDPPSSDTATAAHGYTHTSPTARLGTNSAPLLATSSPHEHGVGQRAAERLRIRQQLMMLQQAWVKFDGPDDSDVPACFSPNDSASRGSAAAELPYSTRTTPRLLEASQSHTPYACRHEHLMSFPGNRPSALQQDMESVDHSGCNSLEGLFEMRPSRRFCALERYTSADADCVFGRFPTFADVVGVPQQVAAGQPSQQAEKEDGESEAQPVQHVRSSNAVDSSQQQAAAAQQQEQEQDMPVPKVQSPPASVHVSRQADSQPFSFTVSRQWSSDPPPLWSVSAPTLWRQSADADTSATAAWAGPTSWPAAGRGTGPGDAVGVGTGMPGVGGWSGPGSPRSPAVKTDSSSRECMPQLLESQKASFFAQLATRQQPQQTMPLPPLPDTSSEEQRSGRACAVQQTSAVQQAMEEMACDDSGFLAHSPAGVDVSAVVTLQNPAQAMSLFAVRDDTAKYADDCPEDTISALAGGMLHKQLAALLAEECLDSASSNSQGHAGFGSCQTITLSDSVPEASFTAFLLAVEGSSRETYTDVRSWSTLCPAGPDELQPVMSLAVHQPAPPPPQMVRGTGAASSYGIQPAKVSGISNQHATASCSQLRQRPRQMSHLAPAGLTAVPTGANMTARPSTHTSPSYAAARATSEAATSASVGARSANVGSRSVYADVQPSKPGQIISRDLSQPDAPALPTDLPPPQVPFGFWLAGMLTMAVLLVIMVNIFAILMAAQAFTAARS